MISMAPTASSTLLNDEMPTLPFLLPGELTLTALAGLPSQTPTSTTVIFSSCAPPDWIGVVIQPGDTLESLAQAYGTTAQVLREGNCLLTDTLVPNTVLYVPVIPTATATLTLAPTFTRVPCGPYPGWVTYIVRPGDTLSSLARILGVTVADLMRANCLTSDLIYAGRSLWVPFTPPVYTPAPTSTPYQTFTPTTTFTQFVPPITSSPTPTGTLTPTIPAATPSSTPTPTLTGAPVTTPTGTPTPTLPPTSTSTSPPPPSATSTSAPTSTPTNSSYPANGAPNPAPPD